jgi:hypothetical protein
VSALVAFLTARYAEEWAEARDRELAAGLNESRATREVEAKRAILRRCSAHMNEMDEYPNGLVSPRALLARQTLMDLAAVYSDHPDYDPDWRP